MSAPRSRHVTVPLARRLPEGLQDYAGANAGCISDVRPAAELVAALTP